jgi:hypothetical protein
LIGAVSRIITGELGARMEPLARWAIHKAVERLPADDRERFREEWLAHLHQLAGGPAKLLHAFGCYLGAGKLGDVLAKQPNQAHWPSTVEEAGRLIKYYIETDREMSKLIFQVLTIQALRKGGPPAEYFFRLIREGKSTTDIGDERVILDEFEQRKLDEFNRLLRQKIKAYKPPKYCGVSTPCEVVQELDCPGMEITTGAGRDMGQRGVVSVSLRVMRPASPSAG